MKQLNEAPPENIIQRILQCDVYKSGQRFTSEDIQSLTQMVDLSKVKVNYAIARLVERGDICFLLKNTNSKGINENVYTRSIVSNWLRKPWVSEPSPDEDSYYTWEYAK